MAAVEAVGKLSERLRCQAGERGGCSIPAPSDPRAWPPGDQTSNYKIQQFLLCTELPKYWTPKGTKDEVKRPKDLLLKVVGPQVGSKDFYNIKLV